MKTIRLKEGKERSLLRGHPWVFDGAIASGNGKASAPTRRADASALPPEGAAVALGRPGGDSGETVRVQAHDGRFLAWGAVSPASRIRVRVWSFDEAQRIDASFFIARCDAAVRTRSLLGIESDGIRLVHGESDGLPGLIVDRYGDTLVAQFGSAGAERWKAVLADALLAATGCTRLYERSDADSRKLEGLPAVTGWLRKPAGDAGATDLTLREHGWQLTVDIAHGHKTGFYLDQRDARKAFADACARYRPQQVLNCFSYTGGFTVAALYGGAGHVTSIDSSGPALERASAHVALNGFGADRATMLDADVNASLRQFLDAGRQFDAIVLDPPKFAPTSAQVERAARAYKDINRLALKALVPGGLLFTFSCSGGVSADLFHKIVASAGADAGVDGYIIQRLAAAADHPATLNFPEGEYLKGLVVLKK
jgi:23S rRNA (cytosine1962-C5)-methyltransferase